MSEPCAADSSSKFLDASSARTVMGRELKRLKTFVAVITVVDTVSLPNGIKSSPECSQTYRPLAPDAKANGRSSLNDAGHVTRKRPFRRSTILRFIFQPAHPKVSKLSLKEKQMKVWTGKLGTLLFVCVAVVNPKLADGGAESRASEDELSWVWKRYVFGTLKADNRRFLVSNATSLTWTGGRLPSSGQGLRNQASWRLFLAKE